MLEAVDADFVQLLFQKGTDALNHGQIVALAKDDGRGDFCADLFGQCGASFAGEQFGVLRTVCSRSQHSDPPHHFVAVRSPAAYLTFVVVVRAAVVEGRQVGGGDDGRLVFNAAPARDVARIDGTAAELRADVFQVRQARFHRTQAAFVARRDGINVFRSGTSASTASHAGFQPDDLVVQRVDGFDVAVRGGGEFLILLLQGFVVARLFVAFGVKLLHGFAPLFHLAVGADQVGVLQFDLFLHLRDAHFLVCHFGVQAVDFALASPGAGAVNEPRQNQPDQERPDQKEHEGDAFFAIESGQEVVPDFFHE